MGTRRGELRYLFYMTHFYLYREQTALSDKREELICTSNEQVFA